MESVDLMAFDLDVTLVRSGEDLAAAVNHTLQELRMPALPSATIQGFIGDGTRMLVSRALGLRAGEWLERAMPIFSAYYSEHLLDHTILYPDVLDVLDHYRDKKKILLTNKNQQYTLKIAAGLGIDSRFLEIIGEGGTPYRKPDPRLLQMVMDRWEVTPRRTVVIGDGVNDILLAKAAGTWSCACLAGLTEREKLLSLAPDRSCETLAELKTLFD